MVKVLYTVEMVKVGLYILKVAVITFLFILFSSATFLFACHLKRLFDVQRNSVILYTIKNLNSSPATSKHMIPDCVSIQNRIYGSSLTLIEWRPHILFLHVLCNDTDKTGPRSVTFPLGAAYVLYQNINLEILLHVEIPYIKYNRPKYIPQTDSTLTTTDSPQKYSKDDISTQSQ